MKKRTLWKGKRKMAVAALAAVLLAAMPFYVHDSYAYATFGEKEVRHLDQGVWKWIDCIDGKARCYFYYPVNSTATSWRVLNAWNGFDRELYSENANGMMTARTPDGYEVNEAGRWVVDGVIQTRDASNQPNRQNPPTSEEIVEYLCWIDDAALELNNRNSVRNGEKTSTKEDWTQLEIDYSREPVQSGVTNIRLKGHRWEGFPSGWCWHMYKRFSSEAYLCALAFDENGYLYVNTTTPDGLHVNEYGMLEIDGRPVVHTDDCRVLPPLCRSTVTDRNGRLVTERNHADLSQIDVTYMQMCIDNYMYDPLTPFGQFVYNHLEFVGQGENGYIYSYGEGFGNCVERREATKVSHTELQKLQRSSE